MRRSEDERTPGGVAESESVAESDSESESDSDPVADSESESDSDSDSDPVADSDSESDPDPVADPVADPDPGERREPPALSPVPVPVPVPVPPARAPFQRGYLIACCAIIGGSLAYWLAHWAQLPLLLYVPLQRRWTFTAPLTTPVITYFGLILWGAAGTLCGALVGALADLLFTTTLRRPLSGSTLRLFGAWAITAFLLAGWYYTWNLWPF